MAIILGSVGYIWQVNVSTGGVPKIAVAMAEVTDRGIVGDNQRDKRHHGGPQRAVSLFSWELIQALQVEGHPIYPGSTGENITVAGIDWAKVVPKTILLVGEQVQLEITSYAVPCQNIRDSFCNGDFFRISPKLYKGWARAYARVMQMGVIQSGDRVLII